jgi:hypothetical protein
MKNHGSYHAVLKRKGVIIDEWDYDNLVVNQGLNYELGVALGGIGQITQWYLGIFQGNYTPVASDTAANWAANATECSSYMSATRPAFSPAAASGQQISNSATPATFTFTAGVTVYCTALVSSNTIAGTGGTLFSEALFGAAKTVVDGDQLLVTYTLSASSS